MGRYREPASFREAVNGAEYMMQNVPKKRKRSTGRMRNTDYFSFLFRENV